MCTRESAAHAILGSHPSGSHPTSEIPNSHQDSTIDPPGPSMSGTPRLERATSLPSKQISGPLPCSSKRKSTSSQIEADQSLTPSGHSKQLLENQSNEPPNTPGALSIEVDHFPNYRVSKRPRKTPVSSNSSLLIKAYLKNPINPVTCPSLLKIYTAPHPHQSPSNSPIKNSVLSSSRSQSTQLASCDLLFPPKLNGPFLRIISEDESDLRRINAMLYGPIDPTLIDPKINSVIYYIYDSTPQHSPLPLSIRRFRYEVFDPAILNSPLVPIRDPLITHLRPFPITHQISSSARNQNHSAAADGAVCRIDLGQTSSGRSASRSSFHRSERDLGSTTTSQTETSFQISQYLDTCHLTTILDNSEPDSKQSFQEAYLTRDAQSMVAQSTSSNIHDGDFSVATSASHCPVYAT